MSFRISIGLLFLTPLLFVAIVYLCSGPNEPKISDSSTFELEWKDLQTLNLETGKASENVMKNLSKIVKIPGFIVPLSSDMRNLNEFLLVPNAQACYHVPPPPPNLQVYVKVKKPVSIRMSSRAVWIEGQLRIEKSKSDFGEAAWSMYGKKVTEYHLPRN